MSKKKSLFQDFKEFAVKGNMIDLAVGIIIGSAFTKIVNSLVNAIIMPALGMLIGRFNFSNLQYVLKEAEYNAAGEVEKDAIILKYGEFIQAATDFFIIALVIFFFVRFLNSWKKKAEDPKNKEVPTPKDIELLSEIRDLLKAQNGSSANRNQT